MCSQLPSKHIYTQPHSLNAQAPLLKSPFNFADSLRIPSHQIHQESVKQFIKESSETKQGNRTLVSITSKSHSSMPFFKGWGQDIKTQFRSREPAGILVGKAGVITAVSRRRVKGKGSITGVGKDCREGTGEGVCQCIDACLLKINAGRSEMLEMEGN